MTEIKFDFSKINIPTASSKVYKDECCLCFDTPECEGGLNVCLNTFLGFCPDHVKLYNKLTTNNVFLNIKKIKHEIPVEELKEKAPTRLAIGVEGGFDPTGENKYKYEELHCLVCLEPINKVVPLPDENLPEKVKMSVSGVIGAMSASKKEDVAAWEGDAVVATKYAEGLKQINQHNVPRGGWKCTKCDLTENLWMCLTCGEIGCGRKNYDGSGGNNHGVEHHKATGHPLVVKLGTITPEAKADVYSYFEDQMVLDPHLVQHLEFFGINITEMKKTEKTMAELNLDFNVNFDSHRIQESGKDVYGGRFTGLRNLGNSCYLASVMQVLMSIPEFEKRYHDPEFTVLSQSAFKDPHGDIELQLIKLANALISGKYSEAKYIEVKKKEGEGTETIPAEQEGIPPKAFKSLIGKGHPEFSTGRQQDALEFLQHVCQHIERAEHVKQSPVDPTQFFKFQLEERLQCMSSSQVKYVAKTDNVLNLPVPLDKAINKEEYEEYEKKMTVVRAEERKQQEERKKKQEEEKKRREAGEVFESAPEEPKPKATERVVRPHVPMAECVKAFGEPELIEGFYSTAAQKNTTALKTTKFATFPDYLFVSVRRFVLDGWVPRKLDVFIDNPQELDLSSLRAKGLQPGEVELPKEAAKKPEINVDQGIVQGLIEMGFSKVRAEKAAYHTKNSGLENAMTWMFDHERDRDIDTPLEQLLAASSGAQPKQQSSAKPTPSEELISVVTDLGIPRDTAIFALQKCDNNPERAIDFVFSYGDDIGTMMQQEQQQATSAPAATTKKVEHKLTDGEGKYELAAFISHIGSSTASGHYVAHIKKNGNWYIFNDRKVSIAENPPFDMGYIYVYARKGRKL